MITKRIAGCKGQMVQFYFVTFCAFLWLIFLPGQRRQTGWGGDGVETEVAARQLQTELFGAQRAQVTAVRLVNDLASAFFGDALADDHQSR